MATTTIGTIMGTAPRHLWMNVEPSTTIPRNWKMIKVIRITADEFWELQKENESKGIPFVTRATYKGPRVFRRMVVVQVWID